jgi:hypothetical protein
MRRKGEEESAEVSYARASEEIPSWDGKTPGAFEALHEMGKIYKEAVADFALTNEQVAEYADKYQLTIPEARKELWKKRKKGVAAEFNDQLKIQVSKISLTDKRRLHLAVEGRPPGSRTRRSKKEVRVAEASNKASVLQAIKALYGGEYSEPERKKAVADHLGKSPKTLSRWIRSYGWDWDQLVAMGARGHGNSK